MPSGSLALDSSFPDGLNSEKYDSPPQLTNRSPFLVVCALPVAAAVRPSGWFTDLISVAVRVAMSRLIVTARLDEYVFDALRAGASGFLLKDVTAERLFEAVRVVAAGEALLAPAVTRRLISEFAKTRRPASATAPAALAALTPRETEVLRLVAEGLSNPEIAARLVVTEETVKTHVSRVLAKLGLRDRTQAVVAAYETGLVVPARERG